MGLCTRRAELPGDGSTERSKEGYPGTIVGSELGVFCIRSSWVTYFVDVIRIEAFEEAQWWDIPTGLDVNLDPE